MNLLPKFTIQILTSIGAAFFMLGAAIQFAHADTPSASESAYEDLITFFYQTQDSSLHHREKSAAITGRYHEIFSNHYSADNISNLPSRDLYFLQLAAELALSGTPDEIVADHANMIFLELGRRNELSKPNYVTHYRSLVFARNFNSAEALRNQVDRAAIPWHVEASSKPGSGERSVFIRQPEKNQLVARNTTAQMNGVYIVGHPYCVWTQRALTDIERESAISHEMAAITRYLSPFGTIFQSDYEWPAGTPDFEIVANEEDWPEINSWELPTFVFVSDGEVVLSFSGWPSPDHVELFREGTRLLHDTSK